MNVTDFANDLLSRGLSVIPIKMPGKQPTVKWEEFKTRIATPGELTFNGSMALICGHVSGNVECLDIDTKHDKSLSDRLKEVFGEEFFKEIFNSVLVQKTVSGGYHFVYRCSEIGRNQKLARNAAGEVILETRSEGGYIVIAPTEGYKVMRGSFMDIPEITPALRQKLFDYARTLNEHFVEVEQPKPKKDAVDTMAGEKPGEHYNRETDAIPNILRKHGWTLIKENKDQIFFKRPGDSDSKWSGSFKPSLNTFYVYTSSIPQLQQEKAYKPFSLLTMLEYNGDWHSAASDLYHQGYGARHERKERKEPVKNDEISLTIEETDGEQKARPLSRIEKIETWLRTHYEFRRNVISDTLSSMNKAEGTWRPCKEADIWRHIQHDLRFIGAGKIPMSDINNILDSNFVPEFNPFREYFGSLPKWDGADHITALANHVTTDDQEFWVSQFKKALVRSLWCTLDNVVNRIVMVLIQETQESGKSSFIRFLCPPDLMDYYKEEPMNHDKDGEIALAENFLWNLEELDELNKKQISDMKAIISRQSIKQRRAYDRREKHMPRIVNFWGSTNKTEFLTDTQNTRWLCFNVLAISHDYNNTETGVKKINIHQVWAQAYQLYNEKFNPTLSKDERITRDNRNQNFETMTPEKQIILRFFRPGSFSTPGCKFMGTVEIHNHILQNTHARLQINELNIGRALKQLGYTSDTKRLGGKRMRGYWVMPLSAAIEYDNEGQLPIPIEPSEPQPTKDLTEEDIPF